MFKRFRRIIRGNVDFRDAQYQRTRTASHRYAVIDVETTGLSAQRYDRIVEVAVVSLGPDLMIEDEYATLVNPERDVGATHIHGVTGRDVMEAPKFFDVADDLVRELAGRVLVGHNVKFDLGFLRAEFERIGFELPPRLACVDTMFLTGRMRLSEACTRYGVSLVRAHSALSDARATAELLQRAVGRRGASVESLDDLGCECEPPDAAEWPRILGERTEYRREHVSAEYEDTAADMITLGEVRVICCTGMSAPLPNSRTIGRDEIEEAAARRGIIVKAGVSRKVDAVIAADPWSQSGKARKAREYGIPIITFSDFWARMETGWPTA